MPTTVSALFGDTGLRFHGPVRWSHPINDGNPGVYVISMSDDPESNLRVLPAPLISVEALTEWVRRAPAMELDGRANPAVEDLARRLAQFWLPDENVLYIGKASRKLRTRVNRYYSMPLGRSKPHAGGHWLKTLSNLQSLYIFHARCAAPKAKEDQLLDYFVANVSNDTRGFLRDPEHPFPFANLEYPKGTRKRHGISKSTS